MENFWELFWLAPSRVTGVIEANVINNSICRKENILEYQFHSEVEKVRSLYNVPLLQLNAGPYSTSSHSNKIIPTYRVSLQFAKFSLEMNHEQFSSISTIKYSRPSSILLIVDNLDEVVYLPQLFIGLVAAFLYEVILQKINEVTGTQK
ncbi:Hypothetical_protein [Hexamita inflata]|uniref:Hypothetical_protein n=1 Tax=Hexamita inflata TaxID=28002 RepID=A0AA86P1R6_9EUKA|nr:Hypothetical protein HINF_LOCUS17638 [Hexamita inflata]